MRLDSPAETRDGFPTQRRANTAQGDDIILDLVVTSENPFSFFVGLQRRWGEARPSARFRHGTTSVVP
jgi:hypothetical protein